MKKFVIFLFIFLILVFLIGCWNRREFNDILIIQVVGIDKNRSGEFKFMYQVLKLKVLKFFLNLLLSL